MRHAVLFAGANIRHAAKAFVRISVPRSSKTVVDTRRGERHVVIDVNGISAFSGCRLNADAVGEAFKLRLSIGARILGRRRQRALLQVLYAEILFPFSQRAAQRLVAEIHVHVRRHRAEFRLGSRTVQIDVDRIAVDTRHFSFAKAKRIKTSQIRNGI